MVGGWACGLDTPSSAHLCAGDVHTHSCDRMPCIRGPSWLPYRFLVLPDLESGMLCELIRAEAAAQMPQEPLAPCLAMLPSSSHGCCAPDFPWTPAQCPLELTHKHHCSFVCLPPPPAHPDLSGISELWFLSVMDCGQCKGDGNKTLPAPHACRPHFPKAFHAPNSEGHL